MSDAVATRPERTGAAREPRPVASRWRGWWRNPWGRPRFLAAFTLVYLAWSLLPVIVAVQFSFNAGRSRSTWQGFSLRWYLGDPDLSVLHDPSLRSAMFQSLRLAALAMLISAPIGVALALGLARWRGRGSSSANFLMLVPLVTPEIVMGAALLQTFTTLFRMIPLGTPAQAIGHVTFSISYVVIVIRSRLFAIGPEYEEAAMDLGATPLQALRLVLLPLLRPAIFASLMVVFAISIDDFVITAFLTSGAASETVPVLVYSNARAAPNPALNALVSVMLAFTMLAIGSALLVQRRLTRSERPGRGAGVEDFARLEF